jgi:hypothetical protein
MDAAYVNQQDAVAPLVHFDSIRLGPCSHVLLYDMTGASSYDWEMGGWYFFFFQLPRARRIFHEKPSHEWMEGWVLVASWNLAQGFQNGTWWVESGRT